LNKKKSIIAEPKLFTNSYLATLITPLIGQQMLTVTIGLADTIMVSSCGEVAISSVALVDTFSILFIQLFAAFATGGAAVMSQYLGRKEEKMANQAARQLFYICLGLGILVPLLCIPMREKFITALYGNLEKELLSGCLTYFIFIFGYFPFLGIYNVIYAMYLSLGNTKITLKVSIIMNCTNILLNAVFIYHFNMGVAGAGLATFISWVEGATILLVLQRIQKNPLSLHSLHRIKIDTRMCRRIASISIPNAIENSMFNIGKILVQRIISTLGISAIASAAVLFNIGSIITIPGVGLSLASTTVIGRCVGAGKKDQARYYSYKLQKVGMVSMFITILFTYPFLHQIIGFYHLTEEASALTYHIIATTLLIFPLAWPSSFTIPNFIRAAGDAKFTMYVSVASMLIVRVGGAYLLSTVFHFGLMGVWLGMYSDWVCRTIFFVTRLRGNKWLEKSVI